MIVSATVIMKPKDPAGKSVLDLGSEEMTESVIRKMAPDPQQVRETVDQLKNLGFQVTGVEKSSIFIAGTAEVFEDAWGCKIQIENTSTSERFVFEEGNSTVLTDIANDSIAGITLEQLPMPFNGTDPEVKLEFLKAWQKRNWSHVSNPLKQYAVETGSVNLWELPSKLGNKTKTLAGKPIGDLRTYENWGELSLWPYEYKGTKTTVVIIDDGVSKEHPIFNGRSIQNINLRKAYFEKLKNLPYFGTSEHLELMRDIWNLVQTILTMEPHFKKSQAYYDNQRNTIELGDYFKANCDSLNYRINSSKDLKKQIDDIRTKISWDSNWRFTFIFLCAKASKLKNPNVDWLTKQDWDKEFFDDKKSILDFVESCNKYSQLITEYKLWGDFERRFSEDGVTSSGLHGISVASCLAAVAPGAIVKTIPNGVMLEPIMDWPLDSVGFQLKNAVKQIKNSRGKDDPKTAVINCSFRLGIAIGENADINRRKIQIWVDWARIFNILIVCASGNFTQDAMTVNNLIVADNFIQVGGGFKYNEEYWLSSNSVGLSGDVRITGTNPEQKLKAMPPDICAFNGGPQKKGDPASFPPIFPDYFFSPSKDVYSCPESAFIKDITHEKVTGRLLVAWKYKDYQRKDYLSNPIDSYSMNVGQGTSLAAPQVAGGCAILASAFKNLRPAEIKKIIVGSGVPITAGQTAQGFKNNNTKDPKKNLGDVRMLHIGRALELAAYYEQQPDSKDIDAIVEDWRKENSPTP